MNVEERLSQLGYLAMFQGKEEWKKNVRESYPQGPTPEGPPWTDSQLDKAWEHFNAEKD